MTRRPIATHPLFAPLIALWFAALLGLAVAVLPAAVLERGLTGIGGGSLLPLALGSRLAVSAAAALAGALIGYALARGVKRRAAADPRPIYAEADPHLEAEPDAVAVRRPLRVHEELADGFGDESRVVPIQHEPPPLPLDEPPGVPSGAVLGRSTTREGFMILTPQPAHPPRPAPDLEALLDQFDTAFEAFQAGEASRAAARPLHPDSDPVQAFVARQTGAAASRPSSPMGGLVPDHQAELRAALDKLARSQRGE